MAFGGGASFKKKPRNDGDMDLTPMIDCVFQLLIFFMVSGQADKTNPASIPPAKHGVGANPLASVFVTMLADPGGGPARMLLGDGKGEEVDTIDPVKRYVLDEFKSGKSLCVVKADRDVHHGKVQEMMRALAEIEGLRFAVSVQDVPDQD